MSHAKFDYLLRKVEINNHLACQVDVTSMQSEANLQQPVRLHMRTKSLFALRMLVCDLLSAFCFQVVQSQSVLSPFCVKNAYASPGVLQCPLLACPLSCFPTKKQTCQRPLIVTR